MKAGGVVNLDLKAPITTADLHLLKSLVGSCRRLGMFSYPNMLARYKEADLPSFVWVCIEEVKRFDVALYKLCAKVNSLSPEDRSLLPANELQFPLPSNDALWYSTERDEWEAYARDENAVSLKDDAQAKWISNHSVFLDSVGP